MSTLLDALNSYLFAGIPSNAVWDLIKVAWEKASRKSWEELYLDAFRSAVDEMRPNLVRYVEDGEICLDREMLSKALHHDLGIAVSTLPFSQLSDDEFADKLTGVLCERQALIIGGHNLDQIDYLQLVRNLVRLARTRFRQFIVENEMAFREAMLKEEIATQGLIQEVSTYLAGHFSLVLEKLDALPGVTAEAVRPVIREELARAGGIQPVRPMQAPCYRNPFVGRSEVIEHVQGRLASDPNAFVTIVGMPGAGKTALADQIACQAAHRFPDGVIWLHLVTYDEGKPQAVEARDGLLHLADAYGHGERAAERQTLEARRTYVASVLGDKQALLVLDDAKSTDQLLPLLSAAGRMPVIVTTQLKDIDALRGAFKVTLDEGLSLTETEELFVTYLGQPLNVQEREAVAELHALTGGLPLALTLLASRVGQGSLSLPVLAERVRDRSRRLAELESSEFRHRPDMELRHAVQNAVKITFQLSYESLLPKYQSLFRRLSIFSAPTFSLASVAAISGLAPSDVQDHLDALTAASLVLIEDQGRYSLHTLLRDFGRDLLKEREEEAQLEEAHAHHFLEVAKAYDDSRFVRGQWATLAPDWPDVMAGQAWAARQFDEDPNPGSAHLVLDYSEALRAVAVRRSAQGIGLAWLEAGLRAAEQLNDLVAQAALRQAVGQIYQDLGDLLKARGECMQAVRLAQMSADLERQAAALTALGSVLFEMGDLLAAQAHLQEAVQVAQHAGLEEVSANAQQNLAGVYQEMGDFDTARDLFLRAGEVFANTENRLDLANVTSNMAALLLRTGQATKALSMLEDALARYEELGAEREAISVLSDIAVGFLQLCRRQEAEERLSIALERAQAAGYVVEEARAYQNLSAVHAEWHEIDSARAYLERALDLYRQAGNRKGEIGTLQALARLGADGGNMQQAGHLYLEALQLAEALGYQVQREEIRSAMAGLLRGRGEFDQTHRIQAEVADFFRQRNLLLNLSTALSELGLIETDSGNLEQALRCHEEALRIARATGQSHHEAMHLNNIAVVLNQRGQNQEALDLLNNALAIAKQLENRHAIATQLLNIGKVYLEAGQLETAMMLYSESLEHFCALDLPFGQATALANIGGAYAHRGDAATALSLWDQAHAIFKQVGSPLAEVIAQWEAQLRDVQ